MTTLRRRLSPAALAALTVFGATSCDRPLELVDDAVVVLTAELPFSRGQLPDDSRSTLAGTLLIEGAAEVPLQIDPADPVARATAGYVVTEASEDRVAVVRVYAARSPGLEPALLAEAVTTVTLLRGQQVDLVLAGDDVVTTGDLRFDVNRNSQTNLDDLRAGCDPAVPPPFFAVSATDLQFASLPLDEDAPRQIVVIDNLDEGPLQISASVLDAAGVTTAALVGGALEGGTVRDLAPRPLAAGAELLLAVRYRPAAPFLTTGALVVDATDACGVTQSRTVRIIANAGEEAQPPAPGAELAQPVANGPAAGLRPYPLGPLYSGLPLEEAQARPLEEEPAHLHGEPYDEGWLVHLPAGASFDVLLSGLDADYDLALSFLDENDALAAEPTLRSARGGTTAEFVSLEPSDDDRRVAILVVLAVPDRTADRLTRPTTRSLAAHISTVPTIDALAPASGPAGGGTPIVVTGKGLRPFAQVRFGTQPAGTTSVDANGRTLTAVTPPGSVARALNPVTVRVEQAHPGGWIESAEMEAAFTYLPGAPVPASVVPAVLDVAGGVPVVVRGVGFADLFGPPAVRFGDAAATGVVLLATGEIAAVAPAHAAGAVDVTVENVVDASGTRESATLPGAVSYLAPTGPPPSLTGVAPAFGPSGGGIPVDVYGQGFATPMTVFFGALAAASVDVQSSTLAVASPPPAAPGPVEVRVVVGGQLASGAAPYVYLDATTAGPTVSAVLPAEVHAGFSGEELTLLGSHLDAGLPVASVIGPGSSWPAAVTSLGATSLRVTVTTPLPAVSGYRVSLAYPPAVAPTPVESPPFVAAAPTVLSLDVVGGPPLQSSSYAILLSGTLLRPARLTAVRFDRGDGAPLDRTAATASEDVIRVDIAGGTGSALPQGAHAISLIYDGSMTVETGHLLEVGGECGNGVREALEACDGFDLGGETCSSQGFLTGQLACGPFCTLVTAGCSDCGDGTLDPGEVCDGVQLGGLSCDDVAGYDDGILTCDATCRLSAAQCTTCGDGIREPPEACDGLDLGGAQCMAAGLSSGQVSCGDCRLDHTSCYTCGDGLCFPFELAGDLCPADCTGCGNGMCDGTETCQSCPTDCGGCQPHVLEVVAGGGQVGFITEFRSGEVNVRLTDAAGTPIPYVPVTFTEPPGAKLFQSSTNTDVNGLARTFVFLGATPGEQVLTVEAHPADGTPTDPPVLEVPFLAEDIPVGYLRAVLNAPGGAATPMAPGNPALFTSALSIAALHVGPDGSVYWVDETRQHVARLTPDLLWVEPVAGTFASSGLTGDGGPAAEALLASPADVTLDSQGRIYIADSGNERIRRVAGGVIEHFAGGGAETGDFGDGGPASVAFVGAVRTIAIDPNRGPAGTLYLFAAASQRIRRIDLATGVIDNEVSFATPLPCAHGGTVSLYNYGDRLEVLPDGRLLFQTYPTALAPSCGVTSTDYAAVIYDPNSGAVHLAPAEGYNGLTYHDDAIYFDPYSGHEDIERLDRWGQRTVIAGSASGVTYDLLVPALDTELGTVADLAVTSAGDLLLVHTNSILLIKGVASPEPPLVSLAITGGDDQSTLSSRPFPALLRAQALVAGAPSVDRPVSVSVSDAALYFTPTTPITDPSGNIQLSLWAPRSVGTHVITLALPDTFGALDPLLTRTATAHAVAPPPGTVVTVVNESGTYPSGTASAFGPLHRPSFGIGAPFTGGLHVEADDSLLFTAAAGLVVSRLTQEGNVETVAGGGTYGVGGAGDGGPATSAYLTSPRGMDVDAFGYIYVADASDDRVRRIDPGGIITTLAGGAADSAGHGDGNVADNANLDSPVDVAVAADGTVYIAESARCLVRAVDPITGIIRTVYSTTTGACANCLASPHNINGLHGLAVGPDGAGGEALYLQVVAAPAACGFADRAVVRLVGEGTAGAGASLDNVVDGLPSAVQGLDFDPVREEILIGSRHAILRTTLDGTLLTTWGDEATTGYAPVSYLESPPPGEDGPALFDFPQAFAFDSVGRLYVVDAGNYSIRMITYPAP